MKFQSLKVYILAAFFLCAGVAQAVTFTNCPASTNLGCNPVSIPGCDPGVGATNNCGPPALLVSSYYTSDVKRYHGTTGTFIDTFASGGGLNAPEGLVFGPDGNLYVSSSSSDEVKRYNGTTGAFIDTFATGGGLDGPIGLVFGPDGNLYVCSAGTSDVKRYNGTTGAFIDTFASGGGLSLPIGLAFGPDGNLYVSSYNTSEVKRYNGTTGAFMDTFASGGGLSSPTGLVFGPDGSLYVSSVSTSNVKRYNGTTGAFMDDFASGSGLAGPSGLMFGPDGNLYVCSFSSSDVKRYNGTTGAFMDNFASGGGLAGPSFLVFTPSVQPPQITCAKADTTNGCAHTRTLTYVAVDGCNNSNTCTQVITWTENTMPPTFTNCPPATLDLGCNPTNIPDCDPNVRAIDNCGLAMAPAYLLVSSTGTDQVNRYDGSTGAFIDNFASDGGLAAPLGLVFGPDGNLYVSSAGTDQVKRYDGSTGAFIDTFVSAGSGGLSGAQGLVFGSDGNLYVSSLGNNAVKRYNGTTGAFIDTFVSAGSGGLDQTIGLTFGPDGNLYVSSYGTSEVLRYDGTTGAFMDAFASGNGLAQPTGLVFGPDGNLYVSSYNSASVNRYNGTTGAFVDSFASGGGLDHPAGLVFGPDGNLYVCSYFTHEVKRYNGTTGAFIDTFAFGGGLNGPDSLIFMSSAPPPQITCAAVDTTNGCARTRTITYTAVDSCNNSNTCTQVITWTEDTTAPTLTCASNKTVECGSGWSFDPPNATDTCCGTNVTITVVSTVTNGKCPQLITRTWRTTDCCSNSVTCSQTVTNIDTTPPVFVNCPASTNLGCNPVSIPNCDPNVRATDNCGSATNPPYLLVSSYNTHEVKRYHGTTGTFIDTFASGGGLSHPYGLVFGPDGNLYVSSADTAEVKRYNGTTGAFMDTFASGGGLSLPAGLVFGPDGNLYISSQDSHEVKRYHGTTGAFIDNFVTAGSGGLFSPLGLVFGSDGNLYVSSLYTDEVKRYHGTTGAFIDNFVSAGSGGLDGPFDLVFGPDGNLYVSNTESVSRVYRYNGTTGAYIDDFGSEFGLLSRPQGLVFGPDCNLYVSSEYSHAVKRWAGPLSSNPAPGTFIGDFVPTGSGGLDGPTFLIFTPSAPLVTCASVDTTNGCARTRTITYTAIDSCCNRNTCTQVITWTEDTTPPVFTNCPPPTLNLGCNPANIPDCDSAVGATNDCGVLTVSCALVDSTNNCLRTRTITYTAMDACNNSNTCVQVITWTEDTMPPTFTNCPPATLDLGCNPTNIPDCDPNVRAIDNCATVPAYLLVSSYATHEVKRYHGTMGTFIDTFASGGGLNGPEGLVFGPDGNLYVSSYGTDEVKRYNGTTGVFIDTFASGGGLDGPVGLVFGPDRNLYVSSAGTDNVKRYNGTTGVFIDTFASGGGLVNPYGLAFGPDGNLYVSNFGNHFVKRYNGTTGAFIDTFASLGGLQNPYGLVFGPDGNLYVSSAGTGEVKRYNGTTGAFIDTFASGGALNGPRGFAFSADGNLYVSSLGTDSVKRYNGTTGAFIDNFASGGGLDGPTDLIFTPTAPVVTCAKVETTSGCARTRTITYTAVDSCGHSNTCTQVITWTVDTALPVFTNCPASTNLGCNPATIPDCDSAVGATNDCGVATVTCAKLDTTHGCEHTRTITYIATNICGNSNTCTQVITWTEDTTPPGFTCASNKTVECGSPWSFDPPATFDDCSGTNVSIIVLSTVTNGTACALAITRTWLATDECANTNTCAQTVTVVDTTPPAITCSPNKTVECASALSFDSPSAFDACCGTNVTITVLSTVTNGVCPQVITRTWQAADCCTNTATCSQTVKVVYPTPYAFSTLAGSAGQIGTNDGTGSAGLFYYPQAMAVDTAGNVFVADSYNFTVRKITPAGAVTTLAGSAGQSGSDDGTGSAARFTYADGVAVDSAGNVYVSDPFNHTIRKISSGGAVTTLAGSAGQSGSDDGTGSAARFNLPIGVATDTADNVYVGDQQNHTIRKITPAGVVTTLAGSAGQIGNADGTGGAARFYNPGGVAADSAGNVYVADTGNHTIRKITPAGEVTTLAGTAGQIGGAEGNGSAARFSSPSGVAVDSSGIVYVADAGNNTIRKITPAGDVTTVGGLPGIGGTADGTGSTARFNTPSGVAVDSAGNLYVADKNNSTIRKGVPASPNLTCATNKTVECGTAWSFDPPAASDTCSGTNVTVTILSTVTNGFCPQLITRTWQATDSCGNTNTCSQTVTVVDTVPPILTCASNKTVECGSAWSFDPPAASDTCSGTNVTVTILDTVTSGFCPQLITRTWQATDSCGNTNTCSQTVTVVDTTAPLINCPSNTVVNADPGQCSKSNVTFTVTASDSCGGVTVGSNPASGSTFPVGTTTVSCTATDACGNTAACAFTVRVVDREDPVIICPTNRVVECTSPLGTPVFFTIGATDNCGPTTTFSSKASGDLFPEGTTTVDCAAFDASFNSSVCSFTVKVVDTTRPAINCPTNMIVGCNRTNGAVVFFTVGVTDICDTNVTLTCTPTNGSLFLLGTTNTVTCTAVDHSGNSNGCSFTITVVEMPPVLSIELVYVGTNDDPGVLLSWPVSCNTYVLEETTSLSPVIVWTTTPEPVVVLGYQNTVTVLVGNDVGSSRVDLQACKLEYSIVSPK